jgi:hypothetical protein
VLLSPRLFGAALLIGIWLALAPSARALTGDGGAPGGLAQFRHSGFAVIPSVAHYTPGQGAASTLPGVAALLGQYRGRWETAWDERGNRPNLIQGSGIPLVPGRGNNLRPADVGVAPGQNVTLPVVERLLRRFIDTHPALFRVAQADLLLHTESSDVGSSGRLWLVEFEVSNGGVPIQGARVFFRINSGNIIQFGTELVGDLRVSRVPSVSGDEAVARALRHANVDAAAAQILKAGVLKIYPELTAGEVPGERYRGAAGTGYAYRLVREVDFRRVGDHRTYRAVVDAGSGAVLELCDANKYATATVTGGIFPNTNTDAEIDVPLPNVLVTSRRRQHVTDENGEYTFNGGLATAKIAGPLVQTNDTCGPDVLRSFGGGNLDFGTSGGTDCTTPGKGGKGNTHASRTAFFQLNRIKEAAMSQLPNNNWLTTQLSANTNLRQTCNAFWDGSEVNFFQSGGGCANTGEIASAIMHEFGHGLDQNTGGAADDGSGEAVGDITAFLEVRQSCIAPNFQPGVPCHNCESTGCTGVRDLAPFSTGGAATIASPSSVTSATGIDCGQFACGVAQQPYRGPMGYEGHCESLIASTAVWDLTQSLVSSTASADAGYAAMQQLWYRSLFPTKSAYQVVSGGQCNPSAAVDGCGATNWYTVLLAIDDDDGNLGNGTPNGCRIWQAFNDHGIACGAQPPCFANP